MSIITRAGVAAVALLCGSAAARAQVFKSAIDAVRIDVRVTSDNRPVGGLTVADFEVLDNGVAQRIDNVAIEEVPFSMLLLLDVSESMAGAALADLKVAATAAVAAMRQGDRASVVTFSEALRRQSPWLTSGGGLSAAIASLKASGTTSLFDAAFAGLMLRDPDPGRRALILLFSDGDDTSSWLPAAAAIDKASRTDAVVYSVVLGAPPGRGADQNRMAISGASGVAPAAASGANVRRHIAFRSGVTLSSGAPLIEQSPFLPELATRTGGEAWRAETSSKLRDAFERIVSDFRSRYLLSYSPTGVETPGWHKIEVRVKGRRATVTARRGYQK